jgi:hypothetical protein
MRPLIKTIYFPLINLLIFVWAFIIQKEFYYFLIIPILNLILIFLKHFLRYKKLNVNIFLFDFAFLFSFLPLFIPDQINLSFLVYFFVVAMFFFIKEYSFFSNIPIHEFIIVFIMIIIDFFNKNNLLIQYNEIFLLSLIPQLIFYNQLLFIYLIRIFTLALIFYQILDFNIFLSEIKIFMAIFSIIYLLPLKLKKFTNNDLIIKFILFLLEIGLLYLFVKNYGYFRYAALLIYFFANLSFYFIKNRLFNK